MKKRVLLSLAALTLVAGWGDLIIQPLPAGAESEAGLEAPMFVGRRRNRAYQQQQRQQHKMEAQKRRADQMDANRRARAVGRLKKKDIIHNYGGGHGNKTQGQQP